MTTCPLCRQPHKSFEQFGHRFYTCYTPGCDWKGVTFSVSKVELRPDGDFVHFWTNNQSTITLIESFAGVRELRYTSTPDLKESSGDFRLNPELFDNLVSALILAPDVEVL